ncbi:MAG: GNAT family N-acetyltransferase [Anaerolineaceae bacterium]
MIILENIVISSASLQDLNSLRKLEDVCFPVDHWPLIDLISVLMFPGTVRLKAEYEDNFVGFIAGDVRKRQNEGWITTLGVFPQYRKYGIARLLLTTCEKQMNVPQIKLSVRKSNTEALNLYFQNGYLQKDIWKKYYIDGEDAIVLEKIVDFK